MSGEMEGPHVYEDLEMEEKPKEVVEKKSQKRWVAPVSAVGGALLAAAFFGAGFAVAYFVVPGAGR